MDLADKRHQDAIKKAEASVAKVKDEVARDPRRMKYHLMAPAYWVNDPCGLVQYRGEYHLFYQYNPYAPVWGNMHWGHAKSKDLIHWEHLPIAIAPSEPYDTDPKGGIFTGCAMVDDDMIKVIYCGSTWKKGKLCQVQCLASSRDGIHFEKSAKNPIISAPPREGSENFRDPNIWKHNGLWHMVLGSCRDGRGKALLYTSENMEDWKFCSVMAESDGTLGTMWECPDFFPLDGKYVLIVSPMGLGKVKGLYFVGDFDEATGKFTWQTKGELDYGFEYYAPQTFEDEKHRRIMFGWLNSWDWMPWFTSFGPTVKQNWCGSFSLPRELYLNGENRLCCRPAEETKLLRDKRYHWEKGRLFPGDRIVRSLVSGECLEIMIAWNVKGSDAESFGVFLRADKTMKQRTVVRYEPDGGRLTIDRNHSGPGSTGISSCFCAPDSGGRVTLHLFVDTSCVELYGNDGEVCMTDLIYPDASSVEVEPFSEGGKAEFDTLDIFTIKPLW